MGRRRGIRTRGNSLQLDFYYKGVRCRETLRIPPTRANILYAESKLAAIKYAIETGQFEYLKFFPGSKRGQKLFGGSSNTPIAELLQKFLKTLPSDVSPSTRRDYQSAVDCHLLAAFGDIRIGDLQASMVEEWRVTLEISAKRINNVLIPLRTVTRKAARDRMIPSDPLASLPNSKHTLKEPRPFSTAEIELILAACPAPTRNLLQFAFWSGMRTGELIELRWFDIDMQEQIVRVRRSQTRGHVKEPKTKAGTREVVLLPPAKEALVDQKRYSSHGDGQVFTNPRTGRPWRSDSEIRKAWVKILGQAQVEYRNPYQTRHTYASHLLMAGINPVVIAGQLGHKDTSMVFKRYGRWIGRPDQTILEKIGVYQSHFGHLGTVND